MVGGSVFSPGTPSDTTSSLSSFTSTGQQLLSPESIDSVVLTMSPVDQRAGIIGKTSTFKAQNRKSMDLDHVKGFSGQAATNGKCPTTTFNEITNENGNVRGVRPTPPSTLNVIPLRVPPAPPPRYLVNKAENYMELTPIADENLTIGSEKLTPSAQLNELLSPNANTTVSISSYLMQYCGGIILNFAHFLFQFQTISKRLSPEGECKTSADTMSSQGSHRWQNQSSKDSSQNTSKILSPNSESSSTRTKRHRARKESKHYQTSDILESPQVYCRSNLGDKISDYEDLWTPETAANQMGHGKGPKLSSFRPEHRPDLLPETRELSHFIHFYYSILLSYLFLALISFGTACVTSPIEHLLSPTNASAKVTKTPSEHSHTPTNDDENTVVLRQNHHNTKNLHERNNNDLSNDNQKLKEIFSPSADLNRLQILADFNQESMLQQPRNRLGLLLTPTVEAQTPFGASTPVQTPVGVQSKRSSPFYAEPADALLAASVVRRSQRTNVPPKSQRHSEPPKCQLRNAQFNQILSPVDSEKSHNISGSLDELKKQPRLKAIHNGRSDPWPVDSSWEFMQNDDTNDYDTDANWNKPHTNSNANQHNGNGMNDVNANERRTLFMHPTLKRENRLTANQIIAKRLPDLRISELLMKTVLPAQQHSPNASRNDVSTTSLGKSSRLSAYDNVERNGHSGYATSLIYHGSIHSDDGTVFSEPWDSSQWDSFMPNDGELFWMNILRLNSSWKN